MPKSIATYVHLYQPRSGMKLLTVDSSEEGYFRIGNWLGGRGQGWEGHFHFLLSRVYIICVFFDNQSALLNNIFLSLSKKQLIKKVESMLKKKG